MWHRVFIQDRNHMNDDNAKNLIPEESFDVAHDCFIPERSFTHFHTSKSMILEEYFRGTYDYS